MEILQHAISGELYALEYADPMNPSTLYNVDGPLSAAAARVRATERQADKLIELLSTAPVPVVA